MAAAVLRGREILSSVVCGQAELHRPYGGVVPELASRDHVRGVQRVVADALARAQVAAQSLEGIAVTAGPGLPGEVDRVDLGRRPHEAGRRLDEPVVA
jgi:N6-L-threonylcarbamoyladenine synthase